MELKSLVTTVAIITLFVTSTTTLAGDYVIHAGSLIDGVSGKARNVVSVLVENDKITAIEDGFVNPQGDQKLLDLKNHTIMPGLFDLHAHLMADESYVTLPYGRSAGATALVQLRQAQAALQNGFTTIRSMGEQEFHYSLVDVKHAIERGEFEGPRLFVAPHMWGPTGGHGDLNNVPYDVPGELVGFRVKAGTDNIREMVREEIKYGADWIKVATSGGVMSEHDDPTVAGFTQEEMNSLVNEAHRYKKKVAAHAHGNAGVLMAVKAGVDSIEHATMMEDDTISLMVKNNVWLVPTVWIVDGIAQRCLVDGPQKPSESNCKKIMLVKKNRDDVFKKAYKQRVKMGFGVDAIYGVKDNSKEFASLVMLGVAPLDAIKMATINSAELLGIDDQLGSIEVGKLADIIAVKGDPLKDITEMERILFVMKEGKVVRSDRVNQK